MALEARRYLLAHDYPELKGKVCSTGGDALLPVAA